MIERKVVCFGEALWDVFPGERIPGGAPLNVALRLQRFGIQADLVSRVGRDSDGDALIKFLQDSGLSTCFIQRDPVQPTGTVQVDVSDPREVHYTISAPVAWDFIDSDAYFEEASSNLDVLVFGSLAARGTVSNRSLRALLDAARLRVFDVNLRPPFNDGILVRELLAKADWAKLNESELQVIADSSGFAGDLDGIARHVKDAFALDVLCITLGPEGAMVLSGDDVIRQKAFDVNVVDTVGCGDAFLGAWLSGMLAGKAPTAALQNAAAVAAIVASSEGANPEFTDADLNAMMATAGERS